MNAIIITIGDEILLGQIKNTNAAWLASEISNVGIECLSINTVQDDLTAIKEVFKYSLDKADIVFVTGGLGPTNDDKTKKALCDYFQDQLIFNAEVFSDIENLFKDYNKEKRENLLTRNKEQTFVPSKCITIRNKLGTAPGMWFHQQDKHLISMPGVPFEMKNLARQVISKLQQEYTLPFISHETVIIRDMPESELHHILSDWESGLHQSVKLSYLPKRDRVCLRLLVKSDNEKDGQNMIKKELDNLLEFVEFEFVKNNKSLEFRLSELLNTISCSLASAESCTSGLISKMITSIQGSSNFFKGGVVAYQNEIKQSVLDIPVNLIEAHSAVSEEVVREMAINVRKQFNSDFSIATSGYAGPIVGESKDPVGTVFIAVASPSLENDEVECSVIVKKYFFTGGRSLINEKASRKALEVLIYQIGLFIDSRDLKKI